jgi:hypothetical protein
MTEPPPLTWRNVSTPNLRDFIGSDRGRDVARIYQTPHRPEEEVLDEARRPLFRAALWFEIEKLAS